MHVELRMGREGQYQYRLNICIDQYATDHQKGKLCNSLIRCGNNSMNVLIHSLLIEGLQEKIYRYFLKEWAVLELGLSEEQSGGEKRKTIPVLLILREAQLWLVRQQTQASRVRSSLIILTKGTKLSKQQGCSASRIY